MPWVPPEVVGQPVRTGQLFKFDPLPPNTFCLTTGGEPPELPDPDGLLEPPEAAGTWVEESPGEPAPPKFGSCICWGCGGVG